MSTMTITASRRPNKKESEDYRRFMRSSNIDRLVVKVNGEGEDMVLEIEQKDADGRTLLHG